MSTETAIETRKGREVLDAAVKTRVPKELKTALELIAANRHLEVADIVREAFREYVAKNDPGQLELPVLAKKEAA